MNNAHELPMAGAAPVREFRVKSVRRFIVTDWSDYRGGSVREITECDSLAAANEIAEAFGRAVPGSLVNKMDQAHIDSWDNADCRFAMTGEQSRRLERACAGFGGMGGVIAPETQPPMTVDQQIDGSLTAVPYAFAATVKRLARAANDTAMLARFDRLQVAVDA